MAAADLPESSRAVLKQQLVPDEALTVVVRDVATGESLVETLSEFEKELIVRALKKTNWVKNRAAKLLNLKRTTLVEKMKKINLCREDGAVHK